MSRFGFIKISKVYFFAVKVYVSREFISSFVIRNPKKPRSVVSWWISVVVDVLLLSHFTQIAKSVVKTIAIDVIKCLRNIAIGQKPRKLMSPHTLPANTNLQIPAVDDANFVPGFFVA